MDYFEMAERQLDTVSCSPYSIETDKIRVAKAEVYAQLAHSQVLREINNA